MTARELANEELFASTRRIGRYILFELHLHVASIVIARLPHAVLSLSSLIFESVPRERVIGKPMIWQEFRLHNIP
jgi:hypothetical protein